MRYRTRAREAEAVCWKGGAERLDAICAMMPSTLVEQSGDGGLVIRQSSGDVKVALGEWIVREEGRVVVRSANEFACYYELAE